MFSRISTFAVCKGRANNDANNKMREKILTELSGLSYTSDECMDPEYGTFWTNIKTGFETVIKGLCPCDYSGYKMVPKAGRNYNYDFDLEFFDERDVRVHSVKLEFKFGSKSIKRIPQIYQKNTNWQIMPVLYHEFFYDGPYIDEMIGSNHTRIERDVYMKHIMGTKYDCHPFFKNLYDTENEDKLKRIAVVKRSIREYLEKYGKDIDISGCVQTLQQTQRGKQYILYDPREKRFYCDTCDFDSCSVDSTSVDSTSVDSTSVDSFVFGGIKKNNTVILKSSRYEIGLLLRWKNHQGILHPAWQVRIKKMDFANLS
jgi:hypothetical protein